MFCNCVISPTRSSHCRFFVNLLVMATNMELGWEFEGDRRQWMAFSEENNNSINETHNDTSKSSVKLTVNSVLLEIKLDKMVQRNCMTGWERRIRCAVKDDSGDCEKFTSSNVYDVAPLVRPLEELINWDCLVSYYPIQNQLYKYKKNLIISVYLELLTLNCMSVANTPL